MEFRRLYITLQSAHGLKDVNRFSKMDVYADVSLAGYPQSRQRTAVDKNSGPNPKWNHRMEFVVDEPYLTKPGLSLLFSLKTESTFGSDKDVGTATVPIHDLFRPDSAASEQIIDYQVVTASGKPKGTLKFSYRFGDKFTHQPEAKRADEPAMAYPPPQYAYPKPQYAYPAAGPSYAPPPPAAAGYGYGGYPPQMGGYGQPPVYGYGPVGYPAAAYAQPQKPKKNKMGMGGGLGMGLGAGLLGGLLVGEMASDIGEAAAYADGYDDAMGDFDF